MAMTGDRVRAQDVKQARIQELSGKILEDLVQRPDRLALIMHTGPLDIIQDAHKTAFALKTFDVHHQQHMDMPGDHKPVSLKKHLDDSRVKEIWHMHGRLNTTAYACELPAANLLQRKDVPAPDRRDRELWVGTRHGMDTYNAYDIALAKVEKATSSVTFPTTPEPQVASAGGPDGQPDQPNQAEPALHPHPHMQEQPSVHLPPPSPSPSPSHHEPPEAHPNPPSPTRLIPAPPSRHLTPSPLPGRHNRGGAGAAGLLPALDDDSHCLLPGTSRKLALSPLDVESSDTGEADDAHGLTSPADQALGYFRTCIKPGRKMRSIVSDCGTGARPRASYTGSSSALPPLSPQPNKLRFSMNGGVHPGASPEPRASLLGNAPYSDPQGNPRASLSGDGLNSDPHGAARVSNSGMQSPQSVPSPPPSGDASMQNRRASRLSVATTEAAGADAPVLEEQQEEEKEEVYDPRSLSAILNCLSTLLCSNAGAIEGMSTEDLGLKPDPNPPSPTQRRTSRLSPLASPTRAVGPTNRPVTPALVSEETIEKTSPSFSMPLSPDPRTTGMLRASGTLLPLMSRSGGLNPSAVALALATQISDSGGFQVLRSLSPLPNIHQHMPSSPQLQAVVHASHPRPSQDGDVRSSTGAHHKIPAIPAAPHSPVPPKQPAWVSERLKRYTRTNIAPSPEPLFEGKAGD